LPLWSDFAWVPPIGGHADRQIWRGGRTSKRSSHEAPWDDDKAIPTVVRLGHRA